MITENDLKAGKLYRVVSKKILYDNNEYCNNEYCNNEYCSNDIVVYSGDILLFLGFTYKGNMKYFTWLFGDKIILSYGGDRFRVCAHNIGYYFVENI